MPTRQTSAPPGDGEAPRRSVSFDMSPMPPGAAPRLATTTSASSITPLSSPPRRVQPSASVDSATKKKSRTPLSEDRRRSRSAGRMGGRASAQQMAAVSPRPHTHSGVRGVTSSQSFPLPRTRTSLTASKGNSRLYQPITRKATAEVPAHWNERIGRRPGEIPRWSLTPRSSIESSGYGFGRTKRVTISAPEPEPTEEELEQTRQEEERQRQEAEAAAERIRQERAEECRVLRAQVAEINQKIAVRLCAHTWLRATQYSRVSGPLCLPESERALAALPEAKLATPKDAVIVFLLAAFKYKKDRSVGERMLAPSLHPDHHAGLIDADHDEPEDGVGRRCSRPLTPGKRKIRKATRLRLQGLRNHTLASYVMGASPENGYAIDPESVSFKFNLLLSSPRCGQRGTPTEGDTATVHVVTSGALPPTRAVHLTFHKDQWKVQDFSNLCTNVLPPVVQGNESDGRVRATNLIQGIDRRNPVDRGFVKGHMRIFDANGKVIGYEKTRASLQRPRQSGRLTKTQFPTGFVRPPQYYRSKHFHMHLDDEKPDIKRHERARESTRSKAEDLVADDFSREWLDNPSLARRVVTGETPSGAMAELIQKMRLNGMVVSQHVQTWRSTAALAVRAHRARVDKESQSADVQQQLPAVQSISLAT